MLDADCYFYFNWKLDKKELPTSLVYYISPSGALGPRWGLVPSGRRISQKREYRREPFINFLPIIESIAKSLESKVGLIDRIHTYGISNPYQELGYLVTANKVVSKNILFEYLTNFPLLGYKYFAVMNIKIIHDLAINKKYKTSPAPGTREPSGPRG